MNLVKEYKGVKIFVSIEGEFYCDANTNSNDYKKKTFVSTKLQSIEKAIDDFKGQEIDGNRYYDISVYNTALTPLRIIRWVGNRLFFDDGTDTSNHSRRNLYPKSIDEKQEFKDLELLFDKLKENQKEINNLYEIQKQLRAEADKKIRITYPAIVEVSQTEDFIDDPYMRPKRKQICICKLGGKFVCVKTKEEHLDWTLDQIKHSINSGAISGLTLEYWNYARKI